MSGARFRRPNKAPKETGKQKRERENQQRVALRKLQDEMNCVLTPAVRHLELKVTVQCLGFYETGGGDCESEFSKLITEEMVASNTMEVSSNFNVLFCGLHQKQAYEYFAKHGARTVPLPQLQNFPPVPAPPPMYQHVPAPPQQVPAANPFAQFQHPQQQAQGFVPQIQHPQQQQQAIQGFFPVAPVTHTTALAVPATRLNIFADEFANAYQVANVDSDGGPDEPEQDPPYHPGDISSSDEGEVPEEDRRYIDFEEWQK